MITSMLGYYVKLIHSLKKGYSISNPLLVTLRWLLSVYHKTLSIVLGNTVKGVVASILARICHLLSLLLPLKAIMLAAHSTPPRFFRHIYANITVDDLVFLLVIGTLLSYLANIALQSLLENQLERGVKKISSHTKKVSGAIDILSETMQSYKNVIKSLSSFFYFFFVVVLLALLKIKLAIVFISTLLTPWLLLLLLWKYINDSQIQWLTKNRKNLQQRWVFLVFIFNLIVIIIDTMTVSRKYSVLSSVKLLVMSRHALMAANEFVTVGFLLFSKREKINKLFFFFFPKYYKEFAKQKLEGYMVTYKQVRELVSTLIESLGFQSSIYSLKWNPMNVYGVFGFDLQLHSLINNAELTSNYFFKVFQPKYSFVAQHEYSLLRNTLLRVPAPKLIAKHISEDYECLLFEMDCTPVDSVFQYEKAITSALTLMWSVDPSSPVLDSYRRTHECGIDSLDHYQLQTLTLVCESEMTARIVAELTQNLEVIKRYVINLPMALHNPEIAMPVTNLTKNGDAIISQWGRWTVEPIGTALWSFNFLRNSSHINHILDSLKQHREDCATIQANQLLLSGELYKLWKMLQKQNFTEAVCAATKVLELFKGLNSIDTLKPNFLASNI